MSHKIKVAEDFSRTPGGRLADEGPYSGEEFREKVLRPAVLKAMEAGEKLTVDLDGAYGYACGWLEEVFGGLARELNPKALLKLLEFISTEEHYLPVEIEAYIMEARGFEYERENF